MKNLFKKSLTVLAGCIFVTAAIADTTNNFETAIVQAQTTKDVQPILSALPDAEQLWPQQPDKYFESMKNAAHILEIISQTNSEARQGVLVIFSNILSKPFPMDVFPTNYGMAGACIESQADAAVACSWIVTESDQQPLLILFAKYVGKLRSNIIPHYTYTAILFDSVSKFPPTQEDQKAKAENEKNVAEGRLQQTLQYKNKELTSYLILGCSYHFPSSNPANADFIKQISEAAQLTDAERSKL